MILVNRKKVSTTFSLGMLSKKFRGLEWNGMEWNRLAGTGVATRPLRYTGKYRYTGIGLKYRYRYF